MRTARSSGSAYYPFGMMMPHPQNTQPGGHRFGFQGQLADDEMHGNQNSYAFKARIHDPRIGRFLSIDPLAKNYPHYSPYQFSGNKLIAAIELGGLEPESITTKLSDNKYKFNEAAIKLLSFVSGAKKETLEKTTWEPRTDKLPMKLRIPLGTDPRKKYQRGAFTLKNQVRMSRNFFKGWKHKSKNPQNYYGKEKIHNRPTVAWLSFGAHEGKHLKQASEFGSNLGWVDQVLTQWMNSDFEKSKMPYEKAANRAEKKLKKFNSFLKRRYKTDIAKVFKMNIPMKKKKLSGMINKFKKEQKLEKELKEFENELNKMEEELEEGTSTDERDSGKKE